MAAAGGDFQRSSPDDLPRDVTRIERRPVLFASQSGRRRSPPAPRSVGLCHIGPRRLSAERLDELTKGAKRTYRRPADEPSLVHTTPWHPDRLGPERRYDRGHLTTKPAGARIHRPPPHEASP
jgi:hypothetical protein